MPLGAILLGALIVLPAFLGCDIDDNVLVFAFGVLDLCVLSEAADEGDFVEHGVGSVSSGCPLSAVHACPTGVPSRPPPSASGQKSLEGDPDLLRGEESRPLPEARSGFWAGERASEGRGCFECGTLNADRKANLKGAVCSTILV